MMYAGDGGVLETSWGHSAHATGDKVTKVRPRKKHEKTCGARCQRPALAIAQRSGQNMPIENKKPTSFAGKYSQSKAWLYAIIMRMLMFVFISMSTSMLIFMRVCYVYVYVHVMCILCVSIFHFHYYCVLCACVLCYVLWLSICFHVAFRGRYRNP